MRIRSTERMSVNETQDILMVAEGRGKLTQTANYPYTGLRTRFDEWRYDGLPFVELNEITCLLHAEVDAIVVCPAHPFLRCNLWSLSGQKPKHWVCHDVRQTAIKRIVDPLNNYCEELARLRGSISRIARPRGSIPWITRLC